MPFFLAMPCFCLLVNSSAKQAGNDALNAFLTDPIAPLGISKLFVVVLNVFGVMPMVMASLMFAQGSKKRLPGAQL